LGDGLTNVLDKIVVKPEIYLEVLSSIDLFKEPFIGKKIEISGFVYRENDLKENQFVVGRFVPTPESVYVYPNFDPLSEVNK
jgi:uncharacterized membrane protein YcgQ (UPF0703/DUF1980 family)